MFLRFIYMLRILINIIMFCVTLIVVLFTLGLLATIIYGFMTGFQ